MAEGVDGVTWNVATPAVRAAYSASHTDFEPTASVYFPGAFTSTDFENRCSTPCTNTTTTTASSFLYGNAGVMLQVGPFGAALTADLTSFTLTGQSSLNFRVVRAHATAAWAFWRHQLMVGVGVTAATMNLISGLVPVTPPSGLGPEAGVLLRVDDQPWRLGLNARAPISGAVTGDFQTGIDGVKRSQGYVVPESVVFPGQIEAGLAFQLGPRPLNPRWIDPDEDLAPLTRRIQADRDRRALARAAQVAEVPEGSKREARRRQLEADERAIREVEEQRVDVEERNIQDALDARYVNWPRPKVLVVVDAAFTAPVDSAVAVSSFLDQKLESYGRSWTVSPRVGLEGEPVPDRLVLRVGSYLEPSLFDGGSARQHFTFGGDLKLLAWDVFGLLRKTVWQLSFGADLAPRYNNWGLGLGVWH